METIKDQIWNYGQLSTSDRQEVEAYVDAHPEYRDFLDEVKWLYACFAEAGILGSGSVTDEALAYLVASKYVEKHPVPPLLEASYYRLANKVAEDGDAEARYLEIKQRMEYVASFSDPSSEFERLTGHSLDDPAWEEGDAWASRALKFSEDRGAVAPLKFRSRQVKRMAFPAFAGLGLVLLSIWFGNANERLAYTEPVWLGSDAELIALRAIDLPLDSIPGDVLILKAQLVLNDAQQHWMNSYYWYNGSLLDRAEEMFMEVINRSGNSERLIAASSYFLGKIHLARGDKQKARSYLKDAAQLQETWSYEAGELLKRIGRGI